MARFEFRGILKFRVRTSVCFHLEFGDAERHLHVFLGVGFRVTLIMKPLGWYVSRTLLVHSPYVGLPLYNVFGIETHI